MRRTKAEAVETAGTRLPPEHGHNSQIIVEHIPLSELRLPDAAVRVYKESEKRTAKRILAHSGARVPLLIGEDKVIAFGEIFYHAAKALGWDSLPAIQTTDVSPAQLQALTIAYHRLGELGSFDRAVLREIVINLEVTLPGFEAENIGFEVGELDLILNPTEEPADDGQGEKEEISALASTTPVSRVGDLWRLARHRIGCLDATDPASLTSLMADTSAQVIAAVIGDPPYGDKIDGFFAGKGKHREFVMGSGDMSAEELGAFFEAFLIAFATHVKEGALVYLFMDWRGLHSLLDAGTKHFGKLINLAVWAKDRPGMGSFYRSQHELVLIFRKGKARHRNNIMLGAHGRDRSNVWQYRGARTATGDEAEMMAHHPTPKNVEMIADIILDCTKRGEIVFDPFLGSGTTLIAAEKVGRRCLGLELDPLYADLAVRRWQRWTGEEAVLAATGQTFAEVEAQRVNDN